MCNDMCCGERTATYLVKSSVQSDSNTLGYKVIAVARCHYHRALSYFVPKLCRPRSGMASTTVGATEHPHTPWDPARPARGDGGHAPRFLMVLMGMIMVGYLGSGQPRPPRPWIHRLVGPPPWDLHKPCAASHCSQNLSSFACALAFWVFFDAP
jgi:hypothetical protein